MTKRQSVCSYVYAELTRGYMLEHDEAKYHEKRERIYNVFKIPVELEKFMTYGFFQCLDAFLYVFTFLPLRFIMAFLKFVICGSVSSCVSSSGRVLESAQICDLLKGFILIICCVLMQYVDLSMMYHLIRGQAIIKLYIFFNMLEDSFANWSRQFKTCLQKEVADRLFSSFGQDTLDSLFWTATEPRIKRRHHVGLIPHLLLAIVYVFIHGVLVLFQASTLNVAFNSHNKALLTIMMSNNFVELKGSVFKKFEKNNLFQMSCSDVRERFHFIVLLAIVCSRNLTEFSWNRDYLLSLIPDVLMVLLSEVLVDWVKHAFITKFNEIPATVFKEYTTSISYDMISIREKKDTFANWSRQFKRCLQKESHSDHMDLVSRRMGFIPLPLAVVLVHVVAQTLRLTTWTHVGLAVLFYFCLVSLKVLNSIVLLGLACQYTDEAKNKQTTTPSSPSSTPSTPLNTTAPVQSPTNHKRRLSDSGVTTAGVEELNQIHSCMKRTRSLGHKMNVSFAEGDLSPISASPPKNNGGNNTTFDDVTTPTSQHVITPTSLNVSSLNDMTSLNLTHQQPIETSQTIEALSPEGMNKLLLSNSTVSLNSMGLNEEFVKDMQTTPTKEGTEGTELKQRKPPPKPLHEIDRYTMCSNRII